MEKKICEVCGESLILPLPNDLLGPDYVVPRACACEREKREREEKTRIEREHRELVDRNRRVCFHEKRMWEWTFDNDDGSTPAMKLAKDFVENWKDIKKEGKGLLLWGGVGTGKTFMAACIANALLEEEQRVFMTDVSRISNISSFESNEYFDALAGYDLLIIDDFGEERNTEFALQNVFTVINRRCESGKSTIVTTNLTLDQIKESDNLQRHRINDRLTAMCTPVLVGGESKRLKIANEGREFFKGIFEERREN